MFSTRFDAPSSPTPPTDPRTSDEPPPDGPMDFQAAYNLAKGPRRTMANLCLLIEVEQTYLSLAEMSMWALALGRDWKELRRWKIEHDGWLRAGPPDVLACFNEIEQVLALAVWDITSKITLLTGTPVDPDDQRLSGLLDQLKAGNAKTVADAKQLREDDANRKRVLVNCTLEKARSGRVILDRLKTAISLWAHQRGDFTLSQSDLLDIREAVELFYRTIETPPTEGWQSLDWVIAVASRGVPAHMQKKPPHAYLVHTAVRHVRIVLKLTSMNPDSWPAEIVKSALGDGHKKALIDLCKIMADILIDRSMLGPELEIEAARTHLAALGSILATLGVPTVTSEPEWTRPDSPARWARLFKFSKSTLMRRFKDGTIRHKKLSTKMYQIAVDALPADERPKFRATKIGSKISDSHRAK